MMQSKIDLVTHKNHPIRNTNLLIQAERDRIAGQLHDNLAQDLVFIKSQTAAIRILLRKGETKQALEQVELLEEVSQILSGEVRSLIGELKQTEVVTEGLDVVLKELSESFHRRYQIPVYYEIFLLSSEVRLPALTSIEVFYIAQEALVNICKHAAASEVWVKLIEKEKRIKLIIRDNGRGFNLNGKNWRSREHFGLSIMQARAQKIGARLKIENSAENGTQVRLSIPYKNRKLK